MSHRFSNSKRLRDSIRQQAQRREWKDLPLNERLFILERVSEAVEEVIKGKS